MAEVIWNSLCSYRVLRLSFWRCNTWKQQLSEWGPRNPMGALENLPGGLWGQAVFLMILRGHLPFLCVGTCTDGVGLMWKSCRCPGTAEAKALGCRWVLVFFTAVQLKKGYFHLRMSLTKLWKLIALSLNPRVHLSLILSVTNRKFVESTRAAFQSWGVASRTSPSALKLFPELATFFSGTNTRE